MKFKKFLAVASTATMILGSTMSVMASVTGDEIGDITVSGSIGGAGDINAVNTSVYDVTVPTANSLNFTVDPQGISSLENEQSMSLEDLGANAGIIKADATNFVLNQSSKDIKVSVAITATATNVTLAADSDDYDTKKSATAATALLLAVPSKGDITAADDYVADDTGYVLSNSALTLDFILEKADYVVSKDESGVASYVLATTEDGSVNGHGFGIQIAGYANATGDWTNTTNAPALSVAATYTFADVASAPANYGLQPVTGTTATPPVTAAPDPFANLTVTKGATDNLVITTEQKVTKLVLDSAAGKSNGAVLTSSMYTATDSTLTILGSWLTKFAAGDYVFTATFSDQTTKTFTVKCVAN